jgi:hypothetical protein
MAVIRRLDPGDPDSPCELDGYETLTHGTIRPGDTVVYENEAWRQPDGSYKTAGLDGTYVITAIIDYDPCGETGERLTMAQLTDAGSGNYYEVTADNVRAVTPEALLWKTVQLRASCWRRPIVSRTSPRPGQPGSGGKQAGSNGSTSGNCSIPSSRC